jgi:hypothetical protein
VLQKGVDRKVGCHACANKVGRAERTKRLEADAGRLTSVNLAVAHLFRGRSRYLQRLEAVGYSPACASPFAAAHVGLTFPHPQTAGIRLIDRVLPRTSSSRRRICTSRLRAPRAERRRLRLVLASWFGRRRCLRSRRSYLRTLLGRGDARGGRLDVKVLLRWRAR